MTHEDPLGDLRRAYAPLVTRRCEEAVALIERLRRQPSDAAALYDLQRFFHNLAGTGGSYGYPGVSRLAERGDEECADLVARGGTPASADLDRWRAAIAAVRTELAAPPDLDAGLPPRADPRPPSDAPPRVLLVEDDEQLAGYLDEVLTREAMVVQRAGTVAAARDAAATPPDACLVDVMLPDGSGYDLVSELRRRAGGGRLPIVMMSGLTGLRDKVAALRAGADAFFEKPIDATALAERLRRLLRRGVVDRPRVLSVENDPAYGAYLRTLLTSAGYEVRICPHVDRVEEDLAAFRPDLVLMDILLSDVNGFDLVRFMRQHEHYLLLPVLFLTSQPAAAVRLPSVAAGGDDCLQKSDPPAMILAAVAARLERARLFRGMLERDGLTQLLTHAAFLVRVQAVVAQHRRRPRLAALAMLDVDHFKAVNDTHGHPAGDRVLAALAALLRRRLRQSDLIARYGGEEFAVVLFDIEPADAVRLVERILAEFARLPHDAPGGGRFRTTFSAGIAMLDAGQTDARAWVAAADAALYEAKASGRNRAVCRDA